MYYPIPRYICTYVPDQLFTTENTAITILGLSSCRPVEKLGVADIECICIGTCRYVGSMHVSTNIHVLHVMYMNLRCIAAWNTSKVVQPSSN